MPRGLMDTCQICWLDLQRRNLIDDTSTRRPTCCSKIMAMCQRFRYTLPSRGRSFQAASTLMACIRHVPHVAGHLLLSSCSHWHPAQYNVAPSKKQPSAAKGFPITGGDLSHLWPQTLHRWQVCYLRSKLSESKWVAPHFVQDRKSVV